MPDRYSYSNKTRLPGKIKISTVVPVITWKKYQKHNTSSKIVVIDQYISSQTKL